MTLARLAIAALALGGGVASADGGHLTGSFRAGIGSTTDAFEGDGPQGNPWVLDLEIGWRAMPRLSVVGFADYTRFTDDVSDAFFPGPLYIHQRDLDLGVRIYGHLGPVLGGFGYGAMFHRDHADGSDGYHARGRLLQLIAGVDLVRTTNHAFGVVAQAGVARFRHDEVIEQAALCLNARWR